MPAKSAGGTRELRAPLNSNVILIVIMKQSIKYLAILGLFVLAFFAGKFYGEFRWMTLTAYINLNKTLSYLSYIESNRTGDLRDSLHGDLNTYVFETSPSMEYGWLSPVDTDAIKTSVSHFQAGEIPNVPVVEVRV